MLGVRLNPQLEQRLEELARRTVRGQSYYAREAIREYVEGRKDYALVVAASRDAIQHISLEELVREDGLKDQLQQKGGEAVRQTVSTSQASDRRVSRPARRRTA